MNNNILRQAIECYAEVATSENFVKKAEVGLWFLSLSLDILTLIFI